MESVAEFRVNSGLAPAESGLGSGGNITVVSKSGGNRFRGSVFEYKRNDALDSASKYDDKKQELSLDQFGGSIGGPLAQQQDVLLRQLRGPAADDRPELHRSGAERRGASPDHGRRAGRQRRRPEPERTRAVAPLLAGFPRGTVPTSNALLALATLRRRWPTRRRTPLSFRARSALQQQPERSTRASSTATGEIDTPDRTVTPRRVLATQTPQNFVANHQSHLRHAASSTS